MIQSFNALDPWQLADFTQKVSPNSGKFAFTLRKQKEHEHRFFNILDVLPTTYAHALSNKLRIKLDVIEKIIWDNLGCTILDVQGKSNELFLEHGIDKKLSFESLREILHSYWKDGYIVFSDSP